MITKEDLERLKRTIKADYTSEQLREFIVKCFTHQALLIVSLDFEDPKNDDRHKMIDILAELQLLATCELRNR